MTALDQARAYLKRGWQPLPIPHGEKRPNMSDWGSSAITPENVEQHFNGKLQNIGVLLGPRSGGLVDVDLDCPEAERLAPHFLPNTPAVFGRTSKPKSHYLFYVHDETEKAAYKFNGADGAVIAELRTGGGGKAAQTVFPGSVHPSGEPIEWARQAPAEVKVPEPAEAAFSELSLALTRIALAVVFVRCWPCKSNRHMAALPVGGLLARAGWEPADVAYFVEVVAREVGDEEWQDRRRTALDAARGLSQGENTYGLPAIRETFGDDVGNAVARLLDYREDPHDEMLARMNERYCVVSVGGKARVLLFEEVPAACGGGIRRSPVLHTIPDFKHLHNNRFVGGERTVGVGTWWLNQPNRRQYDGLIFRPGAGEVVAGRLNLWRGWGVEPRPGSWAQMRGHIEQVLASGDSELADYIINWTAWTFQNPGRVPEVAVVSKGGKGTGKGIFGRTLCEIFGQHGLHISSGLHLTGRFNAHFHGCALLFADEAYWPGDPSAEGTLKRLITEPSLFIERKGIDGEQVDNCIHLVTASNDSWVVPASMDERRFVVCPVSDCRQGDSAYFAALVEDLDNGGRAAMLYDLLAKDLGRWHPREIVRTAALREQQERSLSGEDQWWLGLLSEGTLPGGEDANPRRAPSKHLFEHARKTVPRLRRHHDHLLGRYLRRRGCRKVKGKVRRGWEFPPLAEARAAWDDELPGTVWDEAADWEVEDM